MTSKTDAFANALHEWTDKQLVDAALVRQLCNLIRDKIIAAIPILPPDWDGHEFRSLLADNFQREVTDTMKTDHKRRRAYRNTCQIDYRIP